MNKGDAVTVRAFGGEFLTRRVVEDLGKTIIICSEAEFSRAQSEGRDPDGIGFPVEDVEKISSRRDRM
jgi:hypothetical protein